MNKQTIIIFSVAALIGLAWYGYYNWGWFGGKRTLASMMPQGNTTPSQNLPPRSVDVNSNPVR